MSESPYDHTVTEETEVPVHVHGNSNGNGQAGEAPAALPAITGRRVQVGDANALNELGEKIFLDRYALKDMTKAHLAVGDLVVVCVNTDTGQREIGTVSDLVGDEVAVLLADGEIVRRATEHVDRPLETHPDEMQARVARGVAAMEVPERRGEWEANFRWLLEGWKFVPGGRILTAAGTEQDLTYYNCMPPDQEVLTENGYQPIGSVQVGDRVVTHRNRLRRVLHTFEREAVETLYSIRTKKLGFDRLRVTGEHKVLAIRAEWVNTHRSRDGLRLQREPEWIAARDLRPGDYLAAAYDAETTAAPVLGKLEHINALEVADASMATAPFESRDGKVFRPQVRRSEHGYLAAGGTQVSVNDVVPVDAEVCELFGRWLGDGCITHRTGTDIPSGIKIVFSLDERAAAEQLADVIERRLGVPAALKLSSTGRWYDLWANSLVLGQLFKSLFGCYSYGKRIPSSLMHMPDDCTQALLRGLFAADGYVSGNKMGILLANRTLATQAHQLLQRLGYFFSIYENTHRLARHPSYRLDAAANECGALMTAFFDHATEPVGTDQRYYLEHDGLRWVRITRVDAEEYVGPVLDLEVEEDHSFVSAGVVVSNCYVIPSPEDSRDGIIRTLSQMTEIMSRGGGVGINLSTLRPRYAYVKGVNGRSSGSVSWGSLYSFVTGLIEQGGSRRGALMLILNVWHPDMLEFIKAKRTMGRITNANISVGVTDDFMAAVEADASWDLVFPDTLHPAYGTEWAGDLAAWQAKGYPVVTHKTVKARELWNVIIESAWASAEPGLWFNERANKASNSWYYAPLVCTNPCVTGDTLVYTDSGLRRAVDLCASGETLQAVVNDLPAPTPASPVFRTGRKPVFRLRTQEGYSLRATADHRIMTPRGWVPLGELQPGDRVSLLTHKGGFGTSGSAELGRTLGWLIGDGTIKADQAVLSFFGDEKRTLAPRFAADVRAVVDGMQVPNRAYPVGVVEVGGRDEARVQSARLRRVAEEHGLVENKYRVPESVFVGSKAMQRGFLQGLFTADGSIQDGGPKGASVRLASSVPELLDGVQMLLLNFGIASRQYRDRRPAGPRALPDGHGGRKEYFCRAQHDLVISKANLSTFAREIGFLDERKQAGVTDYIGRGRRGPYRESFTATVARIEPDGIEDVYDLTEPITHSFVANGLVVHNCGEQPLPGWSVCNLGAINLARFEEGGRVDWESLGRTVRYAVRFLDNVIDATPYFFEENERQQKSERRVGLGTMGLAELMIRCGVRYGSPAGNAFLDQLYKFIAVEAYLASADNAAEKGSFARYEAEPFLQSGFMRGMPEQVRRAIAEKGCRNVTLLTQAPTGTTGTMVATSTGIEPFFSWSYFRKSRLGLHEEKVAVVQEWQAAHPGQDLPDHFVTAMDLAPEEHVSVQATIQRWVDSSISKTCNVPNGYTVEQTAALYETMYRLGCKGGTVYRDGSRDEQVLTLKDQEKEAKAAPTAPVPEVKPRPRQMLGTTYRVATPLGKAYITVNKNADGEPFEVFVNLGKAGSDLAADAEAIGRLISLSLRMPSPLAPRERLLKVGEELDGIGGSRAVGFGTERVRSLPDGIAHAIQEELSGEAAEPSMDQPSLMFPGADLCPVCGHASFVREEGCQKCYSCGHSEC